MPGTPDHIERLVVLETLMKASIENQNESRESRRQVTNDLHRLATEVAGVSRKLDDAATLKEVSDISQKLDSAMKLKDEVEKLDGRIKPFESLKTSIMAMWAVAKWFCFIMAAFFAASLAIGDRIFKIISWVIK